jgi:hypothetical protein
MVDLGSEYSLAHVATLSSELGSLMGGVKKPWVRYRTCQFEVLFPAGFVQVFVTKTLSCLTGLVSSFASHDLLRGVALGLVHMDRCYAGSRLNYAPYGADEGFSTAYHRRGLLSSLSELDIQPCQPQVSSCPVFYCLLDRATLHRIWHVRSCQLTAANGE